MWYSESVGSTGIGPPSGRNSSFFKSRWASRTVASIHRLFSGCLKSTLLPGKKQPLVLSGRGKIREDFLGTHSVQTCWPEHSIKSSSSKRLNGFFRIAIHLAFTNTGARLIASAFSLFFLLMLRLLLLLLLSSLLLLLPLCSLPHFGQAHR